MKLITHPEYKRKKNYFIEKYISLGRYKILYKTLDTDFFGSGNCKSKIRYLVEFFEDDTVIFGKEMVYFYDSNPIIHGDGISRENTYFCFYEKSDKFKIFDFNDNLIKKFPFENYYSISGMIQINKKYSLVSYEEFNYIIYYIIENESFFSTNNDSKFPNIRYCSSYNEEFSIPIEIEDNYIIYSGNNRQLISDYLNNHF